MELRAASLWLICCVVIKVQAYARRFLPACQFAFVHKNSLEYGRALILEVSYCLNKGAKAYPNDLRYGSDHLLYSAYKDCCLHAYARRVCIIYKLANVRDR